MNKTRNKLSKNMQDWLRLSRINKMILLNKTNKKKSKKNKKKEKIKEKKN